MVQEDIIRVGDDGHFRRKSSEFRAHITADGANGFPAVSGRYHLYQAWACPWAHRTMLTRKLLGLEDAISFSTLHWLMDDTGAWNFKPEQGYVDNLGIGESLQDVYHAADPDFPGIGTVPVLWDKHEGTIVNNESRDIVRMLSTEFQALQANDVNLSPENLRGDIDDMIDANYETINNGVYKAGFARSQAAYDEAIHELFERLLEVNALLGKRRFLLGNQLTEADVCLFPTLLRFDPVYQFHFKCNLRRIKDHPNLARYLDEILQLPGVSDTFNMLDTRRHYFASHPSINPHRIIWKEPEYALPSS